MNNEATININGQEYKVISERDCGNGRMFYVIQKPRGKVNYCVTKYENGVFSKVA